MSRISVTIPEDAYDAQLPIKAMLDTQGEPFLDPVSTFECLFDGDLDEASFDPATRILKFAPKADGRAGGGGQIRLKSGMGMLTVDVLLDPPTLSDIIADPADLIVRMTAPVPDPVPAPDPAPPADPAA